MKGSDVKNHKARGISQDWLGTPGMYIHAMNLWENLMLESDNR